MESPRLRQLRARDQQLSQRLGLPSSPAAPGAMARALRPGGGAASGGASPEEAAPRKPKRKPPNLGGVQPRIRSPRAAAAAGTPLMPAAAPSGGSVAERLGPKAEALAARAAGRPGASRTLSKEGAQATAEAIAATHQVAAAAARGQSGLGGVPATGEAAAVAAPAPAPARVKRPLPPLSALRAPPARVSARTPVQVAPEPEPEPEPLPEAEAPGPAHLRTSRHSWNVLHSKGVRHHEHTVGGLDLGDWTYEMLDQEEARILDELAALDEEDAQHEERALQQAEAAAARPKKKKSGGGGLCGSSPKRSSE